MPTPTAIASLQLARVVGTPEDVAAGPCLVPMAARRNRPVAPSGGHFYAGRPVAVLRGRGFEISQGVAAWLRHAGARADVLKGGFQAWDAVEASPVRLGSHPARDGEGRTVWVRRARPEVDRIACAWLLRRFVDPGAVVVFMAAPKAGTTAERFGAAPIDAAETHDWPTPAPPDSTGKSPALTGAPRARERRS